MQRVEMLEVMFRLRLLDVSRALADGHPPWVRWAESAAREAEQLLRAEPDGHTRVERVVSLAREDAIRGWGAQADRVATP